MNRDHFFQGVNGNAPPGAQAGRGWGINFNDVPSWQKRGVGLYWECFDKPGRNPMTGQQVVAHRRRIKRDMDLPMKDEYGRFLEGLFANART